MIEISPSVWFPVVTLVIGIFLKAAFDAWTENRRATFDRESRVEKRKEIILLQRIDMQRKALGDLQLALADMMRSSNMIHIHDTKMHRETGAWGEDDAPLEISEKARNSFRSVTLMRVRVSDSEVRELSSNLSYLCSTMSLVDSKQNADRLLNQATLLYSSINERIGESLRSLEHEEQALLV